MGRRGAAVTLPDDLRRPPEGPFGGYRGPVTLGDHLTGRGMAQHPEQRKR